MPADESKPTNPSESKSLSEARMTSDLLGDRPSKPHRRRRSGTMRFEFGPRLEKSAK